MLDSAWNNFDLRAASRCVLAVAAPIFVGVATGHVADGVLIAAGAFSVGFGSFQELHRSHLAPMMLAAIGMCVSSWVGTLAGRSNATAIAACALASLAYAATFRMTRAVSWVALQCAIWVVISTAYPAHGLQALSRGSLILAGGCLQILVTGLLMAIARHRAERSLTPAQAGPSQQTPWQPLSREESFRFNIRVVVTIGIAAALYRGFSAQNGYWIPMTSLIVIRPALRDSLQRGFERGLGTLAGIVAAALIIAATSHSPWVLAAGVTVFAWGSYALFQVDYAWFAVTLTAYVVFLLSLAGIHEKPLIMHRVLFTLCGIGVALLTHLAVNYLLRSRQENLESPRKAS